MLITIKIECPHCHSHNITRNGKKYNGKQNYLCTQCGRQFISGREMTYQGCLSRVIEMVKIMLVRGIGIRDISAVLQISITKVLKVLKSTKYQIKPKQTHYDCLEIDEFWTHVGKKKNKVWLIYAYHRGNGEIVAYVWGKRDLTTAKSYGINSDLKREYGRAPRSVKVKDSKRGKKYHRVNVVAGQIHDEGGVRQLAPLCYQGAMNGTGFEEWFENSLLKSVERGKTIIMDRAGFHRKKQLEEICKKQEVFLLYLPPCSPGFNPVEKTRENMKKELRDAAPLHESIETATYVYLA
jgi:transposase-like protein/transposase